MPARIWSAIGTDSGKRMEGINALFSLQTFTSQRRSRHLLFLNNLQSQCHIACEFTLRYDCNSKNSVHKDFFVSF